MSELIYKVDHYKAGNIQSHYQAWKRYTSDRHILDIVHYGLTLNFATDNPPSKGPFEYKRQGKEVVVIDAEVNALIQKQVIEPCEVLEGDYFSSLFVAPKKDGTYRTILNLKFLNTECRTSHFKMESLK